MNSLLTILTNALHIPANLSDLTEDSTHRTVTDTEKTTWNAKSNFSGSYNDLTNKPSIPPFVQYSTMPQTAETGTIVQYVGDTTEDYTNGYFYKMTNSGWEAQQVQEGGGAGTIDYDELLNKPQINSVTLSGNKSLAQLGIAALADIPTSLGSLTDDSNHRTVSDSEKSTWNAKSNFSGSYDDLADKPTIPAAQVNSDWEASSGVARILNKPSIPATLSDLSDAAVVTASNNDIFSYSSTAGKWTNKSISSLDLQKQTLSSPVTIQGSSYTTVESVIDVMAAFLDSIDIAEENDF